MCARAFAFSSQTTISGSVNATRGNNTAMLLITKQLRWLERKATTLHWPPLQNKLSRSVVRPKKPNTPDRRNKQSHMNEATNSFSPSLLPFIFRFLLPAPPYRPFLPFPLLLPLLQPPPLLFALDLLAATRGRRSSSHTLDIAAMIARLELLKCT